MINAKTAVQLLNKERARSSRNQKALERSEAAKKRAALLEARKKTLPEILKVIDQRIKDSIARKAIETNFIFSPWMNAELLQKDVVLALERVGYRVEIANAFPIQGEDNERSGPIQYVLIINWDKKPPLFSNKSAIPRT